MISVKEFKDRRAKLYKEMDDSSVLILYAGVAKKSSEDDTYDFLANRNFFYLTNIEQEGSVLLVTKSDNIISEFLFIQEYDANKEKWTGIRLTSDEACKKSGITNVLYLNTFDAQLSMILNKKEHVFGYFEKLYLDLDPELKVADSTTTKEIMERLHSNYNYLQFLDIYGIICKLRGVKTAQEVEELKEAVSKTNIGLNKIIRTIQPGLFEYQMQALFKYTISDYDNSPLSFPTICANGVNATILHYPNGTSKLKDGDLVLFDLGAKNNGYCGDISRTFPVNGKFTDQQKLIYNIVLGCNKMIIKSVKPGITIKDLQKYTIEYLSRKCLEANLIASLDDIHKVYYHSISHHIGLDCHDPVSLTTPLVSGNIISDEPGLYFKDLGIGIRIEDDLLVTDDGCYCLSGNIIKEVSDIEKAMLFKE
ncbi:MAG: aminopeptidase P family protein [Bacilli bacterium]|jgi:Xaa-Pro aminopeptidase